MKALFRLVALLLALPSLALALLVLTGRPTWSGIAYVVGLGALQFGLAAKRHRRAVVVGALGFIALIVVVRCVTGREGRTLRHAHEARVVDRLVEESDISIAATRTLAGGGLLHDDAAELPAAVRDAYARMRADQGDLPSPVVATYLGLQTRENFDLLMFDPAPEERTNERALIFLHGFAGGFALPCWQMASAVASLGVVTACPSTGWKGEWWTPEGEAILRETVKTLHARGVRHIACRRS